MSLPTHISATPGNLLTLEEAESRSRFNQEELRQLIDQKALPAVRIDELTVKVEQRDLEALSKLHPKLT